MKSFGADKEEHGDAVRVSLSGDLDLANALRAEEAIRGAEEAGPPLLVLDLRDLSFMDSTGLRVVMSADKRAQRDGRRLVIVQGRPAVRRVFEITRLDERLDIVADPSEVLEAE